MRHYAIVLAAAVLGVVGCGGGGQNSSDLVPVTGKVVMNGQPVGSVDLLFVPQDPKGATGQVKVGPDGSFTSAKSLGQDGLVPGKYKVVVTPQKDRSGPKIPPQFTNEEKTTLTVEVTADAKELTIPIQ
ncbi:MAG: hypothetical protein K2P78_07105 [Gemmataceae bacterium]|nr:hypothetical protein [Gemmataceae bacterium]